MALCFTVLCVEHKWNTKLTNLGLKFKKKKSCEGEQKTLNKEAQRITIENDRYVNCSIELNTSVFSTE